MDNHINSLMPINFRYIFFFLLSIISTFCSQLSYSQSQPQSAYDYSICRDKNHSYNCGNLSYISYPFWGQNRPFQCGAGNPFHLHCHNNQDTTILLSDQNFTVIEINTNHHIIKLKRTDLSQNLCSPQFDDTYLSPNLFQYLPQVKNITIYYNCSYSQSFSSFSKDSLCGSQNLAAAYVSDELFEETTDCKKHIQVPTEADFHIDEPYEYGYIDRDDLEIGLNNGFEVSYSVVSRECLACLGNQQGKCSWKNDTHIEKHAKSSCYYGICPDGSFDYFSNCSLHKSKQNLTRKLVIGVGSAVFVAFAVIIAIYFYKRKSYVQSRSLSSELTSKGTAREDSSWDFPDRPLQ